MSGNLYKLPIMIVALVIGIIMVTTAVLPLASDYSEAKTFTNEGYFRMSHYDDTTDHTFSWSYENPNYVTVDNVDVKVSGAVSKDITVVADTNWVIRLSTDSNGDVIRMSIIMSTGGTTSAQVSNSTNASMTLSSGVMSATFGTSEKSGTYTDLWLPSNDGAYIMKDSDKDAYINADSELVAYGLTRVKNNAGNTTSSPGFGISMIGTYEDGVTSTIWRDENNNTISNETINVSPVSGYIDLYKVSSITATFTLSETVNDETVLTDTPITYNYFIVPYEVTADPDNPAAYKSLVMVIPLMAFVVLVVAAAAMIYFKKD